MNHSILKARLRCRQGKILEEDGTSECEHEDAVRMNTSPVSLARRVQDAVAVMPKGAKGPKRVKTATSNTHSMTRSKPAPVMSMPADIVCEVAKYLVPLNVLHLSRTSKGIRSVLMSRSSRYVWIASRNNLGMPDCPTDLSEPQYASLVFDRQCQVCGCLRSCRTDVDLRIRLCVSCFKLNVLRGTRISKDLPSKLKKNNTIFKLLPFHISYCINKSFHPPRDLRSLPSDRGLRWMRFFKPDLIRVAREYYALNSNQVARQEFVDYHVKVTAEIKKHAAELEDWHCVYIRRERDELASVYERRHNSIVNKLVTLGYAPSDITSGGKYSPELNAILRQPRELTPRIWKIISPQLKVIIAARRWDKNRRDRRNQVSKFYRQYVLDLTKSGFDVDTIPVLADIFHFPAIAGLIYAKDPQNEVTKEQWNSAVETFPTLSQGDERRLESTCLSFFRSACSTLHSKRTTEERTPVDDNVPVPNDVLLKRASTIFRCPQKSHFSWESRFYSFTKIMRHNHVTTSYHANFCDAAKAILCFPEDIETANALLHSLGLPLSTTMEHMESVVGRRLMCKRCGTPDSLWVMSWIQLVAHFRHALDPDIARLRSDQSTAKDHDLKHPSLLAAVNSSASL